MFHFLLVLSCHFVGSLLLTLQLYRLHDDFLFIAIFCFQLGMRFNARFFLDWIECIVIILSRTLDKELHVTGWRSRDARWTRLESSMYTCGFVFAVFLILVMCLGSMLQHNFTDGMALGSAFLLHGAVGGWSRTLFLLAHELPQEVCSFSLTLVCVMHILILRTCLRFTIFICS